MLGSQPAPLLPPLRKQACLPRLMIWWHLCAAWWLHVRAQSVVLVASSQGQQLEGT
jgi:hypothetical protein